MSMWENMFDFSFEILEENYSCQIWRMDGRAGTTWDCYAERRILMWAEIMWYAINDLVSNVNIYLI